MFDEIFKLEDDKVAYKVDGEELTYSKLIKEAKRYGKVLAKKASGAIIIYSSKSINTFIAIFAAIYAKVCYIPVDITMPYERAKKIIVGSNSSLIIADSDNKEYLEKKLAQDECNVLVSTLDDMINYEDIKSNDSINQEENINDYAYMIYTSGTTGDAKGVPITYDNLRNFIKWFKDIEDLKDYKDINVLNQASFSFDLSIFDIFYSIVNHHHLVALSKESNKDISKIFNVIKNNDINLIVATPTFIKLCLIDKGFNSGNYHSLRAIYFCGEQLEVEVARELKKRFESIVIINAYGPTEATSAVSYAKITDEMLDFNILPCSTFKNDATKIDIEDGEIVLRGESIFNGYLGDIKGGYFKVEETNCFKTGDLGYISNGMLFVTGRRDNQVKYKGYRIELMDIENNIKRIDGVIDAVVIAKYQNKDNNAKNENIVKLIKAFVVLDSKVTCDYVRDELKKLLPSYMIPRIICQIEKMPVTNNLKIDRKELSLL